LRHAHSHFSLGQDFHIQPKAKAKSAIEPHELKPMVSCPTMLGSTHNENNC